MLLDVATDPGLVIIAPCGSGKSYLARSLMTQALDKGWGAVAFDPKALSYRSLFERLTHAPWVSDWMLTDAYERFCDMRDGFLWPTYTARMDLIRSLGNASVDEWRGTGQLRPILVVFDELQAFFTVLAGRTDEKGHNVGKAMVGECQASLASMLALFRASGLVPVLISQTGNTDILSAAIKHNAPAKVQLGNSITDGQWLSLFGDNPPRGMPRFVGGVGRGVCQLAGEVELLVVD